MLNVLGDPIYLYQYYILVADIVGHELVGRLGFIIEEPALEIDRSFNNLTERQIEKY